MAAAVAMTAYEARAPIAQLMADMHTLHARDVAVETTLRWARHVAWACGLGALPTVFLYTLPVAISIAAKLLFGEMWARDMRLFLGGAVLFVVVIPLVFLMSWRWVRAHSLGAIALEHSVVGWVGRLVAAVLLGAASGAEHLDLEVSHWTLAIYGVVVLAAALAASLIVWVKQSANIEDRRYRLCWAILSSLTPCVDPRRVLTVRLDLTASTTKEKQTSLESEDAHGHMIRTRGYVDRWLAIAGQLRDGAVLNLSWTDHIVVTRMLTHTEDASDHNETIQVQTFGNLALHVEPGVVRAREMGRLVVEPPRDCSLELATTTPTVVSIGVRCGVSSPKSVSAELELTVFRCMLDAARRTLFGSRYG